MPQQSSIPVPLSTQRRLAVALLIVGGLSAASSHSFAADQPRKLTGPEIRTMLAGREVTDEVHYRDVFERDGTFRSVDMGRTRQGKWKIKRNELCIDGANIDNGCFEVSTFSGRVILKPTGLGMSYEGIVRAVSDR